MKLSWQSKLNRKNIPEEIQVMLKFFNFSKKNENVLKKRSFEAKSCDY